MSSRSSILSSLWNEDLLNSEEPFDGGAQLLDLLVCFQSALLDGLPDAVLDVVLQQDGADLLQGRDDARDLGEDVHTVRFLVHHALYAPHLTFYSLQTILKQRLVLGLYVAVGGSLRGGRHVATVCRVHDFSPFPIPSPGVAAGRSRARSPRRAPSPR